jgi:hypothetical protein
VPLLQEDYLNTFKQVTGNDFDILTFKDEANIALDGKTKLHYSTIIEVS